MVSPTCVQRWGVFDGVNLLAESVLAEQSGALSAEPNSIAERWFAYSDVMRAAT